MLRPLILLLALVSLPFAQEISRAQGDETKIIALENLWNQMQINHDADAMGKMLDSDFVLTDYDGAVMSKTQFLESIRDASNHLAVEVSTDMKLHRHGDTVIVIGATREKGTEKGKPYTHQGRFTDTWIKKNGQWLYKLVGKAQLSIRLQFNYFLDGLTLVRKSERTVCICLSQSGT